MEQTPCHIDDVPLGWLAPTGEFIRLNWGEHAEFAANFCEREGFEFDETEDAEIFLIRHDWVLIHFAELYGARRVVKVECNYFLTEEQETFLTNFAFDYQIKVNVHYIYDRNYL